MSNFDSRLREGISLLNTGKFPEAIQHFKELAANGAKTDQQRADTFHQAALTFTKMSDLKRAKLSFGSATLYANRAKNASQRFRIMRDLAWVEMVRFQRNPLYFLISLFLHRPFGPLRKARVLLRESQAGLEKLNELNEALVTNSYFGRIALLCRDYETAARVLRQIDSKLLKQVPFNPTYRLNLLMWLIRAVPKKERAQWRDIIESLVNETWQTSRRIELKIILKLGDTGYRIVQWFPERLQKIGHKLVGPFLGK